MRAKSGAYEAQGDNGRSPWGPGPTWRPCGALHEATPARSGHGPRTRRGALALCTPSTDWPIRASGDPGGLRAGLVGSRQGPSQRGKAPIGVAVPRAMRTQRGCQEGATKGNAPLGGPLEASQAPPRPVGTRIATESPRFVPGVARWAVSPGLDFAGMWQGSEEAPNRSGGLEVLPWV